MTETEIRLEYWERTRHFDLPDEYESALENDYIKNRALYTDETFEKIRAIYLVSEGGLSPTAIVDAVHAWDLAKSTATPIVIKQAQ